MYTRDIREVSQTFAGQQNGTIKTDLMSTDIQRGTDIHAIRIGDESNRGEKTQTLMRSSYPNQEGSDVQNRDEDEQDMIQNEMKRMPINRE